MSQNFNPETDADKPQAESASTHKNVDIYKNISNVKLHTSMGVIWPGQEVILGPEEAKAFGSHRLISRT